MHYARVEPEVKSESEKGSPEHSREASGAKEEMDVSDAVSDSDDESVITSFYHLDLESADHMLEEDVNQSAVSIRDPGKALSEALESQWCASIRDCLTFMLSIEFKEGSDGMKAVVSCRSKISHVFHEFLDVERIV